MGLSLKKRLTLCVNADVQECYTWESWPLDGLFRIILALLSPELNGANCDMGDIA